MTFLRWWLVYKTVLKSTKKWRHDVIIVTSKLTLWHKITFILYEKIFASTKKCHFSIAPGPINKLRLRDFDLTQPRDTVTSWRHGMTHPNLFSLSQLVDVLERWFFFVSMELWVAEFENVVSFVFAWWRHVMTSFYDVKNRLYSISASISAREMIFLILFFIAFWLA